MGNPNTDNDGKNIVADALRQGYRAEFADVLRVLYNKADVDNVVLGAIHKDYQKTYGLLSEDNTIKALKENVVPYMFLELPDYRQSLVEEFQKQAMAADYSPSRRMFAWHFEHDDIETPDRSIKHWQFSGSKNTHNFIEKSLAPLLEKYAKGGGRAYAIDDDRGWSEKKAMKELEAMGEMSEEYVKTAQNYYNLRFDDRKMAKDINEIKKDISETKGYQKSIAYIGEAHGYQKGDFEEHIEGKTVRMGLPASYRSYAQKFGIEEIERMNDYVTTIGEDPPALVYFIKEKILATTSNTPPDIKEAIKENFPAVELPGREENAVRSEVSGQALGFGVNAN